MAAPVSSALDSAWQAVVVDNFTELQVATVVTFLLHETVFFLSGLPFLVFERFGLLAKYKIQVRAPVLFLYICYLLMI
jgi:4-alpha-methyl-delta7-sterol-4alpha-methyl oxidase